MKLNDLKPNSGSTKKSKRVGRGTGSGYGKTAGRGMKGQHARAGFGGKLYRQGGNLPFYRRLPFMRGEGFTPPNQVQYNEVKVEQLNKFKAKTEVTPEVLAEANMISKSRNPVVILGNGDLKKELTIKVQRVTKSAHAKIEAAGGTVEIIE